MLEIYASIIRTIVIVGMSIILVTGIFLAVAAFVRFAIRTIYDWLEGDNE